MPCSISWLPVNVRGFFSPRYVSQLASLGVFYLPPKHWRQEFNILSWTPRIALVDLMTFLPYMSKVILVTRF